jgi:hypothetical protein
VHTDAAKECNIFITDTGRFQLRQDGWYQYMVRTVAGHIREDNTNVIARSCQFHQRPGVDGMFEGPFNILFHID